MHAKGFLETLSRISIEMKDVQVIVFDAVDNNSLYLLRQEPEYDNQRFFLAVRETFETGEYPDFLTKMKLIDMSGYINGNDRFIPDGRLNVNGYKKIASEIIRYIK